MFTLNIIRKKIRIHRYKLANKILYKRCSANREESFSGHSMIFGIYDEV